MLCLWYCVESVETLMGPMHFPLKLVLFLYQFFSCAAFLIVPLKFLFFNDVSHILYVYTLNTSVFFKCLLRQLSVFWDTDVSFLRVFFVNVFFEVSLIYKCLFLLSFLSVFFPYVSFFCTCLFLYVSFFMYVSFLVQKKTR